MRISKLSPNITTRADLRHYLKEVLETLPEGFDVELLCEPDTMPDDKS